MSFLVCVFEIHSERALLLDVVVGKSAAVLERPAPVEEELITGGDAFLILYNVPDGFDGHAFENIKTPGNSTVNVNCDKHLHLSSAGD